MDRPKILKIEEVADILRRTPGTVSKDISANPERVPPYFKYSGSKTPLWLEHIVYEWVNKQAGVGYEKPKKVGRPRKV